MKQKIENFGTAGKTQDAYDKLMRRFDSLEQTLTWTSYAVFFMLGMTLTTLFFG